MERGGAGAGTQLGKGAALGAHTHTWHQEVLEVLHLLNQKQNDGLFQLIGSCKAQDQLPVPGQPMGSLEAPQEGKKDWRALPWQWTTPVPGQSCSSFCPSHHSWTPPCPHPRSFNKRPQFSLERPSAVASGVCRLSACAQRHPPSHLNSPRSTAGQLAERSRPELLAGQRQPGSHT